MTVRYGQPAVPFPELIVPTTETLDNHSYPHPLLSPFLVPVTCYQFQLFVLTPLLSVSRVDKQIPIHAVLYINRLLTSSLLRVFVLRKHEHKGIGRTGALKGYGVLKRNGA